MDRFDHNNLGKLQNVAVVVTSDSWVSFKELKALIENKGPIVNQTISFALSHHKKLNESYGILYTNLSDKSSQALIKAIEKSYNPDENFTLYIVDSFECPEMFSVFDVKTAPTLVISYGTFFFNETYLPNIYAKLGL